MDDVLRTTASIALMTRLGEERGVGAERTLRGTGLGSGDLGRAGAVVSRKQELTAIANLVESLGDPSGLGFEAGLRYHLTTYGFWGFALISSPTLRSAFEVGLRFVDLTFAFCRLELQEEDDEARILFTAPQVPAPLRRFVIERDAAAVRVIQQEIIGTAIPLRRVGLGDEVGAGPDVEADRFRKFFDAELDLTSATAYSAFDRELLDLPLPQADPRTTAEAQAQCRQLLSARRVRTGEAARVRDALVARISQGSDITLVAADLHLSPRTLQRRLTAEGTSYRSLLAEVRWGIARELLARGLPVAAVAERLGYAEVSSFSQAFRRWAGHSPRGLRPEPGQSD